MLQNPPLNRKRTEFRNILSLNLYNAYYEQIQPIQYPHSVI